MHERALVSELALTLESLAGQSEVSEVTLAVGPDTSPAVIEEAWRTTTAGTTLDAAALTCVVGSHRLQCLDCGVEYEGGKLSFCPACGGNGLVVEPAPEVALWGWQEVTH